MSTHLTNRFATREPAGCAVCHRHAVWIGYHRGGRSPIVWLCDDSGCHAGAKRVYAMPQPTLDAYEIGAVLEAGNDAGGFLETTGTTDLSQLDDWQWLEFLRRIVVGYERSLRRKILENEPPF